MAARTYLPQLVKILEVVCRYLQRYRSQVISHLPEGGEAAIDGVLTACDVLIALIGVLPIGD